MGQREREMAVNSALNHIVDAASGLTREQCMTAAVALKAAWLTEAERDALRDLSEGFDRLSTAGVA